MALPLLTAIVDPAVEAALVAAFERPALGVSVVRRCVDVADLVAAASTGTARAAVISADLRRLDRDVLARLAATGITVLVLAGDDESTERWLRQMGAEHVLPASATAADVAATLCAAASEPAHREVLDYADPLRALDVPPIDMPAAAVEPDISAGQVVAVWGAAGAPGRTTVAVALADELARLDVATMLVDADVYGGAIAQTLGMLEEAPGIAAACRMANAGSLDVPALSRLARALNPRLRVLTGITRPERWPELRPSGVEHVLQLARWMGAATVVDCGFSLEDDEELVYDTMAPRRNGATLATLSAADAIVAVVAADPVGIQRFIRALPAVRQASEAPLLVVVNKVRSVVVPGDARDEIGAALERYAGVSAATYVPYDRAACDRALANGQPLAVSSPSSPARKALLSLAESLVASPVAGPRRGRRATSRRRNATVRQ